MTDYLRSGFIEELELEKRELDKLKKRINSTLSRVRPYMSGEGSIAIRNAVDGLNMATDGMEEIRRDL